jgi:hypothetical protein
LPNPPGAPKANLDWDEIGKLLAFGCKTTKIASQFGVSERTLYTRCEQDLNIKYTEFSQGKRSKGDNILQAKQFQEAMNGNITMLIWLGKQRLEQREPKDNPKDTVTNNTFYCNYDPRDPKQVLSKTLSATDTESATQRD